MFKKNNCICLLFEDIRKISRGCCRPVGEKKTCTPFLKKMYMFSGKDVYAFLHKSFLLNERVYLSSTARVCKILE